MAIRSARPAASRLHWDAEPDASAANALERVDEIEAVAADVARSRDIWSALLSAVPRMAPGALAVLAVRPIIVARLAFRRQPGALGSLKLFKQGASTIMIGEDGPHLSFRSSLIIRPKGTAYEFVCTTALRYRTGFGKREFSRIRPAHRYAVSSLVAAAAKALR